MFVNKPQCKESLDITSCFLSLENSGVTQNRLVEIECGCLSIRIVSNGRMSLVSIRYFNSNLSSFFFVRRVDEILLKPAANKNRFESGVCACVYSSLSLLNQPKPHHSYFSDRESQHSSIIS